MSSSPVAASPVESVGLVRPGLLELFEQVATPRALCEVRHGFAAFLALALSVVLAGARSYTAVGDWVADADAGVLVKLGVDLVRRPCEATIRRALARVDADQLDGVLGRWMREAPAHSSGRISRRHDRRDALGA